MSSIYQKLYEQNLLNTPPVFLKNNIHYEVITGSVAYGCAVVNNSDIDVVGFGIPPKDLIFPHIAGYITGFDKNIPSFNQFQQHHIYDNSGKKEYDITIFNIVNFFKLAMDTNPNIISHLFVPRRCVVYASQIGEHVRNNRHLFLTKGSFYKFRGYSYSQLNKLQAKQINNFIVLCDEYNVPYTVSLDDIEQSDLSHNIKQQFISIIKQIDKDGTRTKRIGNIAKYGYDTKFAYHIIRLLCEARQILDTHDLILDKDREMYKSIRRGEWSKEKVIDFFERNEKSLAEAYEKSTLRSTPDVTAIRELLIDCLEMHYGSMEKCVTSLNKHELAIRDIKQLLVDRKL